MSEKNELSAEHLIVRINQAVLSADGVRNLNLDSTPMGLPMSDPAAWATAMNNLGMAPMGMTGQPLLPGM